MLRPDQRISRGEKDCYYARGLGERDSQMPKQPTGHRPEKGGALPAGAISRSTEALKVLFGENFRLARVKAGLSQRDIEAETGITQAHISQIEGGKYNPTLTTMAALARCVGKDVGALLRPPTSSRAK